MYGYAFLILLLPFLSFLVLGLCGYEDEKEGSFHHWYHLIGTVDSLCLFIQPMSISSL